MQKEQQKAGDAGDGIADIAHHIHGRLLHPLLTPAQLEQRAIVSNVVSERALEIEYAAPSSLASPAMLLRQTIGKLGDSLIESGIDKGLGSAVPGDPPPYVSIGWLIFNSIEEFGAAFGPHADELMGDLPNFTDIEPQIQISEIQ